MTRPEIHVDNPWYCGWICICGASGLGRTSPEGHGQTRAHHFGIARHLWSDAAWRFMALKWVPGLLWRILKSLFMAWRFK
jgi:hypothetical protein